MWNLKGVVQHTEIEYKERKYIIRFYLVYSGFVLLIKSQVILKSDGFTALKAIHFQKRKFCH